MVPAKADQQLTVVMGDDPLSTEKDKPNTGTHRLPVRNGEYIVTLMDALHKLHPK